MKNHAQGVAPKPLPDNEQVRDFIAMAVHDLREPLRAVRLGAQLATAGDEAGAPDDAARGRRYIDDGLDRMETLIQDIAEYCYAEAADADFQETDLESILGEVQKELFTEIKTSGAVITHDPLPIVVCDGPALATVLRGLIENACKFRSEAPLRIHIDATRQGPQWIFSIRDNGIGFAPAYNERVFRAFERLNGKQYPGSGLGLATAKAIIERHRGKISAESRPGEGATVRFTLPG